MTRSPVLAPLASLVINCVAALSCTCGKVVDEPGGAASAQPVVASASASASAESGPLPIPIDSELVDKAVNPKGEPPYSGPVGSVRGVIRVAGDPAPERPGVVSSVSKRCPDSAKEFYRKLFREGAERRLADAMVAVTGYRGYVPAQQPVVRVNVRDCSWGTRTISATFGQHLAVLNTGRQAYMPKLVGAGMKALLAAIPRGDPIKLYPTKPGRYMLIDAMYDFMVAEVMVVKYPTHTVTGVDGKYELTGIPVGAVTVTAFLPAILQTAERRQVSVVEGKATEVDLTIHFDAKQHAAKAAKAAASARAPKPPRAAPTKRPPSAHPRAI